MNQKLLRIQTGVIGCGLSLVLALSACQKQPAISDPSSLSEPARSEIQATDPAHSTSLEKAGQRQTVTLTDDLKRTVTVPYAPKRVAVLLGSFADMYHSVGGSITATVEDSVSTFGLDLGPDWVNLGVNNNPRVEALLESNPDLVIASSNTKNDVALLPTFEKSGIPVLYFDVNTFPEYLQALERMTQITGRKDLYEQYGLGQQTAIQTCIQKAQAERAAHPPRVLYLRATSVSIKAKGSKGTVLGEMLRDLGCVNVADGTQDLLDQLSLERIIEEDPDQIFIVIQGKKKVEVEERLHQELLDQPGWKQLQAVVNQKVHFMDPQLYNFKPNSRWSEAYAKLDQILRETK